MAEMNAWRDRVLDDPHVSTPAKQLAVIIAKRLCADNPGYAAFYDTDAAAFIDGSSDDIGKLRRELQAKGFLKPLQMNGANNCKPAYRLT
jgi:hypothetical protein